MPLHVSRAVQSPVAARRRRTHHLSHAATRPHAPSYAQAYEWALAQAGARSRERFYKYGQPFTFGPDIGKAGGPLFLDAGITYKDKGDEGLVVV